ncbi:MAG: H-NS family nucleoid-associated regulatory protein [Acidovorax sp.]
MSNYKALLARKAELDRLIEKTRKAEQSGAIAEARALIAEFGLTSEDVFGGAKKARTSSTKVEAKYRDPATGATWTGRGRAPVWIADKDRSAFAI